jgi:hypothetical protein
MATTSITAHVVVEFSGGDDNPNVIVEIDGRENGYNAGKTTFQPGENAYLLLYVPSGWSDVYHATTAGVLTYVENTNVSIEDYVTFIDDETASLQYPVSGTPSFTWLGNDLGVVSVAKQICSLVARAYNSLTSVFTPEHRVGIAKANYVSVARVYRLSSVPASLSKAVCMFVVKKD